MPVEGFVNSSHWGVFTASVDTDGLSVTPDAADPDPSPLLGNIPGALDTGARILHPYVRRQWLTDGPGAGNARGDDEFVEVTWDHALDLAARELERVRSTFGNAAIFGGSYGWASAGRFHHAQSQLHRFLNCIGGYTRSRHTYSHGASEVLLPHVVGDDAPIYSPTTWEVMSDNTDLFVCFGGMPAKNSQVNGGGVSQHIVRGAIETAQGNGARFVLIGPLADDLELTSNDEWIAITPATDTALMLALCWVLLDENLCNRDFLDRYCVGFERFADYLRGGPDGVVKDPRWAAQICGVAPDTITTLARRMAAGRTMVTTSWSLQRATYGEQPLWASIALAAFLGQIGLPGGGFGHGYGSTGGMGAAKLPYSLPTFFQGANPVRESIPVARIADMLLHPGESYEFNGRTEVYPDTKLVYWAGGNPFHHHQDLVRLRQAFARPDTVIVHEPFWTATARHADIVFPVTTTFERNDIGCGRYDPTMVAMRQVTEPLGEAKSDYAILAQLSKRLGVHDDFTENLDEWGWLEKMYEDWRRSAPREHSPRETFAEFWEKGRLELTGRVATSDLYQEFRSDPAAHPLHTPSGRIEIVSDTIAGFEYDDCPPHPTWLAPPEADGVGSGQYPLCLIANNPKTRLHSQLDHGAFSVGSKVQGREPIRLHPDDAASRSISDGDLVLVRSETGQLLAGAVIDSSVAPHIAQLSTGAWFDYSAPDVASCVHGNPNVLTPDVGTSRLSQACTGQIVRVEIEKFREDAPSVTVHDREKWNRTTGPWARDDTRRDRFQLPGAEGSRSGSSTSGESASEGGVDG